MKNLDEEIKCFKKLKKEYPSTMDNEVFGDYIDYQVSCLESQIHDGYLDISSTC